jgi:hypothetical protein
MIVYKFPNGFRIQAQDMYGWLRHYQFTPAWTNNPDDEYGTAIEIPQSEVSQLRLLQQSNPARFGSES